MIWNKSDIEPAHNFMFLYGKGNSNYYLGTGFLNIRKSDQPLRG